MEESLQLLNMFLASLDSKAMSNDDRTELFRMILDKYPNNRDILSQAIRNFQSQDYGLFATVAIEELQNRKDPNIDVLLRQLDDPEVPDEAVVRSLQTLIESPKKDSITIGLSAPIVNHLRPDANMAFVADRMQLALDILFDHPQ